MPAVSQIVACPAGQWTSIAQYMDTRQSLMVQCPVSDMALTRAATPINGVGQLTVLGANPLRRRVIFSCQPGVSATVMVAPINTNFGASEGIPIFAPAGSTYIPALTIDDSWGDYAKQAWFGWNQTALVNVVVYAYQEIYACQSIILGISSASVSSGVSGVPVGIWESPDLLNGGSEFRLSRAQEADLVIQEWFAWPVGSGTVKVQVFQAFDVPVDYSQFTVQMPSLSPHGKKAAMDLLDAMQGVKRNGLLLPTNNEEL